MPPTETPELVTDGLLRRNDANWTLLGNRCADCDERFFPAQRGCAHCCSINMVDCELGNRGTLWSWTVQGFLPKSPYNSGETEQTFKPYGVGYVEMPSGIKVETRLTSADPAQLKIGMPMELVLEPYRTTTTGGHVHTFAFKPAADTGDLSPITAARKPL